MVRRKTLVGDDRADLVAALAETTGRADVVVMSGGLGPTEDDLTAECVAAVARASRSSSTSPRSRHRGAVPEARPGDDAEQRQAGALPARREVIPNRFGTAPGFAVRRRARRAWSASRAFRSSTAGSCEEWLLPRIAARLGEVPAARLVKLFAVPESHADQAMRPVMDDPANAGVRFGYRAHWPEIHVKWSRAGRLTPRRARTGSSPRCARHLRRRHLRRGQGRAAARSSSHGSPRAASGSRVAESCTGGLLARAADPRARRVERLRPGRRRLRERHEGAAGRGPRRAPRRARRGLRAGRARARRGRARRRAGATWGIGITGIAGPTGGTPEKPVGTVHLALAGSRGTQDVVRGYFGDRDRVRRTAAYEALNLLRLATR